MSNLRFNSWFVKMDNNLVVFELPNKLGFGVDHTMVFINSLDLARVRDNTKYFAGAKPKISPAVRNSF